MEGARTVVGFLSADRVDERPGSLEQQRSNAQPLRGETHLESQVVEYFAQLAARSTTNQPMNRQVGGCHFERLERTRADDSVGEIVPPVLQRNPDVDTSRLGQLTLGAQFVNAHVPAFGRIAREQPAAFERRATRSNTP